MKTQLDSNHEWNFHQVNIAHAHEMSFSAILSLQSSLQSATQKHVYLFSATSSASFLATVHAISSMTAVKMTYEPLRQNVLWMTTTPYFHSKHQLIKPGAKTEQIAIFSHSIRLKKQKKYYLILLNNEV